MRPVIEPNWSVLDVTCVPSGNRTPLLLVGSQEYWASTPITKLGANW